MSTPPLARPPVRSATPAALIALVALTAACLTSPARAQPAQTIKDAHLRAGPARSYPVISVLWRGTTVLVQGCLQDYSWCDVVHGGDRGWVYAANLRFEVGSDLLPVPNYGAEIGIGILGFMLGNYWAEHYRDRPWYGDRHRWVRPPSPPPPRLAPHGPPPPHRVTPPPQPQPHPPRVMPPAPPPHRVTPPAPPPRGAPPPPKGGPPHKEAPGPAHPGRPGHPEDRPR